MTKRKLRGYLWPPDQCASRQARVQQRPDHALQVRRAALDVRKRILVHVIQLRESTIHPDTRRLVQLTIDTDDGTAKLMDMLLSKKRASDRKEWLETKGDLASLEV